MADDDSGSHLEEIRGLSHGPAWKLQKVIWLILFISVTAWMGIASYKPLFAVGEMRSILGLGVLVGFSVFVNLVIGFYHQMQGHTRRAAHTGFVTGVVILFLGGTAGFTYFTALPALEAGLSQLSGSLQSLDLVITVLPYLLWLNTLMISLAAASFIYEHIGRFALVLPLVVLIVSGAVFGQHYTETSSQLEKLESSTLSEPFRENLDGYEKKLEASRMQAPPSNKVHVIIGSVNHLSTVYSELQSNLGVEYKIGENCPKISGESVTDIFSTWQIYIHLMETQKSKITTSYIGKCGSNCEYTPQQIRSSFDTLLTVEKMRLKATESILNTEFEKPEGLQSCKLESTGFSR